MRGVAVVVTVTLLAVTSVSAQSPAPPSNPYGLDPYVPSEAALLRNYGATLVAQTPLLDLARLDPYKPSDAALLRQIGGAIPIWGVMWNPPYPGFGPIVPFPRPSLGSMLEAAAADRRAQAAVSLVEEWPEVPPPDLGVVPRQGPVSEVTPPEASGRRCWVRMGDRTYLC